MVLDLITLKYNLGLLILSFGTTNPNLHYIPEKSILIEYGYLNWRGFSLRNFHPKIILINHPPIWDEFWIFECIMGQSKKNEWKEKCDCKVKTQKGSLERKWKDSKDSWAEQTKEWRVNNQEASVEEGFESKLPNSLLFIFWP